MGLTTRGGGEGLAAPLLAILVAGSGCIGGTGPRAAGERCGGDGDCAEGLVCSYGRCRSECAVDRDCGEGEACVAVAGEGALRVCVGPEGDGPCDGGGGAGACPEGLLCGPDGACHEPCEGEPPSCGPGRVCFEGLCLEPEALPASCDDDGDGAIDPACGGDDCSDDGEPALVPSGEVLAVSSEPADAIEGPAVAWSPDGWGVAWAQGDGDAGTWRTRFAVVSLDGSTAEPPTDVKTAGTPMAPPTIAWAGVGFAVGAASAAGTWAHVYVVWTDPEPEVVDLGLDGASFSGPPAVAFDGSAIGAAWVEGGGGEVTVTEWLGGNFERGITFAWPCWLAECGEPALATGSAEHAWVVAHRESAGDGSDGHLAIAAVDLAGLALTIGIAEGAATARQPSLVRAGDGYGLAWVEGPEDAPEARFARLSADLDVVERSAPLGAGEGLGRGAVRLGWDGEAFALAWAGEALGGEAGVHASRRPGAGGDAWPSVLVAAEALETGAPDLAGSAGSWATAYWAMRDESDGTRHAVLLLSLLGTCY